MLNRLVVCYLLVGGRLAVPGGRGSGEPHLYTLFGAEGTEFAEPG